jgi:hypothetical protein
MFGSQKPYLQWLCVVNILYRGADVREFAAGDGGRVMGARGEYPSSCRW